MTTDGAHRSIADKFFLFHAYVACPCSWIIEWGSGRSETFQLSLLAASDKQRQAGHLSSNVEGRQDHRLAWVGVVGTGGQAFIHAGTDLDLLQEIESESLD